MVSNLQLQLLLLLVLLLGGAAAAVKKNFFDCIESSWCKVA